MNHVLIQEGFTFDEVLKIVQLSQEYEYRGTISTRGKLLDLIEDMLREEREQAIAALAPAAVPAQVNGQEAGLSEVANG